MTRTIGLCLFVVCIGCAEQSPRSERLIEGVYGPMGSMIPSMSDEWQPIFDEGERLAKHRFDKTEGLGPKFNVTSCAACHESPQPGGGGPLYRNFRLIGQSTSSGAFLLSGTRSGVYTFHHVDNIETESDARDVVNVVAPRNPIPFFGLGLLELIDDEEILKHADPEDLDGDGISGRANYIAGRIGRLGLKAQATNMEGFVRGPLNNHLGITSDPLPADLRASLPFAGQPLESEPPIIAQGIGVARFAQVAAPNEPLTDLDDIPDPEIDSNALYQLVVWASLLAAPEPEALTPESKVGKAHFQNWGCASCHVPSLNSRRGAIPLYSDLLLHDMGSELADGIEMGFAIGSEFRTAPLWGVIATGPYLHDGRALTLKEAILLHGGEAANSAQAFRNADPVDQDAVLEFLASLGGRSQASTGLIDPETPPPMANELGGPISGLSESQTNLWLEGRRLFDRNFGFSEGLGPAFNGDSCRACHFLGAIGGAGPEDVDVHRFVRFDAGNTEIRHQHNQGVLLPNVIESSGALERRNTPPLFGLSLLDQIPDEFLQSIADPMDLDGDGIRGDVALTADMEIGRFGWQGQLPTLSIFIRDAFNVEMGLRTDDISSDPEISNETLALVDLYLSNLAAPAIADSQADLDLFTEVGCTDCHRIDLPIIDGPQPLTNLLLHDVGTGHFESGHPANRYRTPPLWALKFSPPYLHDGRAQTIRSAIQMHSGEAAASRAAFTALDDDRQTQLINFLQAR